MSKLKEVRESKNLTQQDLANKSGLTVTTINRLENGKNKRPSHVTVRAIARAMRVKPEILELK